MKLGIDERLFLLNILPTSGDITTVKILHDLKMKLSLTSSEYDEYEIKTEKEDGGVSVSWNKEKAEPKEYDIDKVSAKIVIDTFKTKFSDTGTFEERFLPLYLKFETLVGDEKDAEQEAREA